MVRICTLGEPAQHDREQGALDGRTTRDSPGQRSDVMQGARRVPEADRGETRLCLLAREREFVAGERGNC